MQWLVHAWTNILHLSKGLSEQLFTIRYESSDEGSQIGFQNYIHITGNWYNKFDISSVS